MSDNKRKKIALVSALFFHLIITFLCFVFKFSYSTEKEKEDFSDMIYLSVATLSTEDIQNENKEVQEENQEAPEEKEEVQEEKQEIDPEVVKMLGNIDPENKDSYPIKEKDESVCQDTSAINYNEKAPCRYDVSEEGSESEKIFLNGNREIISPGNLHYACDEAIPQHITYIVDITVRRDGSVLVTNCYTDAGVDYPCLEESARSAAETVEFENLENKSSNEISNDGKNIGHIEYTFEPS